MKTYLSLTSLRSLAGDLRHAWQVIVDGHHWRTRPPVPPELRKQAEAGRKAS